MEKLKEKHNHKLTDLIKVGIFSLLIMAPFISIGVRCGYVMWNKNAKDSYSDSNFIYKTTEVQSTGEVVNGLTYEVYGDFNSDLGTIGTTSVHYVYSDISLDWTEYGAPSGIQYNEFQFYKAQVTYYLYLYENGTLKHTFWDGNLTFGQTISFSFVSEGTYSQNGRQMITLYTKSFVKETLDNAFSYSVSQISNDPVFNWTRNTGIYQPINAMVQGLEIENDTLQILLTYWSLITAVYIVFDLIIFCFTKLTHFIND